MPNKNAYIAKARAAGLNGSQKPDTTLFSQGTQDEINRVYIQGESTRKYNELLTNTGYNPQPYVFHPSEYVPKFIPTFESYGTNAPYSPDFYNPVKANDYPPSKPFTFRDCLLAIEELFVGLFKIIKCIVIGVAALLVVGSGISIYLRGFDNYVEQMHIIFDGSSRTDAEVIEIPAKDFRYK